MGWGGGGGAGPSISGSRGKGGPSPAERRRAVERVSRRRTRVPAPESRGGSERDRGPVRGVARCGCLRAAARCSGTLWLPLSFRPPCRDSPGAPPARRDFSWKGRETLGGVQLAKAPPALERKGGCGSTLLPENLANFGQILPPGARAQAGPGLSPATFSFHSV